MSRHSHWNLIASGACNDVAIDIAKSMQYDDRYCVSIFVGSDEVELTTRELDWIGAWLGMLSLELGRGIDQSSDARGVHGEELRLRRDPASDGFQIQFQSAAVVRVLPLQDNDIESLRESLRDALRELGSR